MGKAEIGWAKVLERVDRGERVAELAAEIGVTRAAIYRHLRLRAQGKFVGKFTPGRQAAPPGSKKLAVRLPEALIGELQAAATARGCSVSDVCREALEAWLKDSRASRK